jgi:hypothetical protein
MHLSMRQIEEATEDMAKLVMKRHSDRSQANATKPGTVQRVEARLNIVRPLRDPRQSACKCRNAFAPHKRDDRVLVLSIECLNGMRDGVHAGGCRQCRR